MREVSPFKLRDFTSEDMKECIELFRQMVDHHRKIYETESIPYADDLINGKLQRADENYIKIVAEKKNGVTDVDRRKVVGLLTLEIKGKTCEIDEIVVAEDKRGKGIGKMFFEYAKREALKRGCHDIQVSTAARNVQGLSFYHAMGMYCLGMIQAFAPLNKERKDWWYKEKGKTTQFLGLKFYY